MKIKLAAIISFGILFVSCNQHKKTTLSNYLVGNWETTYLKIKMITVNKTDSTSVFEDDFNKPNSGKAQSSYKKDGTFSAWFKQPNGEKLDQTNGKWKMKKDSLFIDYFYMGKQVQAWYKIQQIENGFKGTSIYDWDNDGQADDTLIMNTKRIK
ncbi:hypothetical protein H0I31_04875 [Tenacibaculum sp. AHE15PA]|uniref:hypothetical protein n=1 Tax=Tenacibaculum TaxID=104267 RepID=UPI001C4F73D3|nr:MULTISPECIES: hypothetical protein [Tenacibaculum]QXP73034.1 hypothetical protein H0I30_10135 [Tenacibaculum sp. AHE14PA]QXP76948.1 hypothetical protein H0I31_04875 [Tenacibaculum sp. AHE15PA]